MSDTTQWDEFHRLVRQAFLAEVKPTDMVRPDLYEGAAGCVATRAASLLLGRRLSARPHGADVPPMREIGDLGSLSTWADFVADVESGCLTDYDGHGELATDRMVSDISVLPSAARTMVRPEWATHVLWYNK